MTSFLQFINESINDKGSLKAIFVVGIPGAGKSYTVSKLGGSQGPKIVNTDKAVEYLSKKKQLEVNNQTWDFFKDDANRITKSTLYFYLNGMLPLFIDGTSNDASRIMHRIGILESIGYDVGMVYVKVDLETSIKRALERGQKIGRHVDVNFIKKNEQINSDNVSFMKSKVKFFHEIDNSEMLLTDEVIQKAYKKTQAFFDGKIENPVGTRTIEKLKSTGEKYLVPTIFKELHLKNLVRGWYR